MIISLENEVWEAMLEFDGYEISNMGRIKAIKKTWASGEHLTILKTKKEHLLVQNISKGYYKVTLQKNNKQYTKRIHRLTLFQFMPNHENKPCINHKNGNKLDNRIENLEWATVKENTIHSYKLGLQISQKRGLHSQAKRVKCDTFDIIFSCIKDAADFIGISAKSIGKVCNNKQLQINGLTFRYI